MSTQAMHGLVVRRNNVGTVNAFIVAWFPGMGAPKIGETINGVMPHEIERVQDLAEIPATWTIRAELLARRTRAAAGYDIAGPARYELEAMAWAHRAARVERVRWGRREPPHRHSTA